MISHCIILILCFNLFLAQSLLDNALLRKILDYTERDADLQNQVKEEDLHTIYRVAKHMYDKHADQETGLRILHSLADSSEAHIASQVALGNIYYQHGNIQKALYYFSSAGENGPHQASLYNTGRIYAELGEWVHALAYVRAAATLGDTNPEAIDDELTESCRLVYATLSQKITLQELSIPEIGDLFIYGSLKAFPVPPVEDYWREAVLSLQSFNETFVQTLGQIQNRTAMDTAFNNLHMIWESHSSQLSPLQAHLVLDAINDMLGPLAGLDDSYIPAAAGYAEALAMSTYCYQQAATSEDEPSCFNGAAASAISFYRRMADSRGAKRVLELARSHSEAATQWDRVEQTPRVYHPGLTAKPWWDAHNFSTSKGILEAYKRKKGNILSELQSIKILQEGILRGSESHVEVEGDVKSSVSGVQRIFTPYIGVRTDDEETMTMGAGGWAEYGPLFDGVKWDKSSCAVVPTICKIFREHASSLCTSRARGSLDAAEVSRLCGGADSVVTILRLRPGTNILPHCGTTNARLILHFCLEGCNGIRFTVGDVVNENYGGGDGSVVVFDDSFEHHVYHGGTNDRYIVLAVLAHPDTV